MRLQCQLTPDAPLSCNQAQFSWRRAFKYDQTYSIVFIPPLQATCLVQYTKIYGVAAMQSLHTVLTNRCIPPWKEICIISLIGHTDCSLHCVTVVTQGSSCFCVCPAFKCLDVTYVFFQSPIVCVCHIQSGLTTERLCLYKTLS